MILASLLWTTTLAARAQIEIQPPKTLIYRGYAVQLAEKELDLVRTLAATPERFLTYDQEHAWSKRTTKPSPSPTRQLIKKINLKTLEHSGAYVIRDEPARGGISLAHAPVPKGDPVQRVLAKIASPTPEGEWQIREALYVELGLPKARIVKILEEHRDRHAVERVVIFLLHFHSEVTLGQTRRSNWYPNPRARTCAI